VLKFLSVLVSFSAPSVPSPHSLICPHFFPTSLNIATVCHNSSPQLPVSLSCHKFVVEIKRILQKTYRKVWRNVYKIADELEQVQPNSGVLPLISIYMYCMRVQCVWYIHMRIRIHTHTHTRTRTHAHTHPCQYISEHDVPADGENLGETKYSPNIVHKKA